jgi:hypothetical protein
MSYNLIEPQYSLLNQCQPCGGKSLPHSSKMASATLGQYATAKIVSPHPESTPHSTRIEQIVSHLNAVNTGDASMQKSKSFLTGYNAGIAKY